jgi:hypothetical protein
MDEYTKQVIKHFEIQNDVNLELLSILQVLCPGSWIMEVRQNIQVINNMPVKIYQVCVTNGDDNVTATNKILGAALAQCIYYLLNGSVFPLTGNMGVYVHPTDLGYVLKENENEK